ncbi:hypothetical protein ABT083_32640 [Streptomyces goshikiensis]|uniref:hypothetical protein n=1 Tax=Streptomyces goshikiensis TaxID=1942 RepID=UPI00333255D6
MRIAGKRCDRATPPPRPPADFATLRQRPTATPVTSVLLGLSLTEASAVEMVDQRGLCPAQLVAVIGG